MGLIKALSKRDLVSTSDLVCAPGVRPSTVHPIKINVNHIIVFYSNRFVHIQSDWDFPVEIVFGNAA